MRPLTTFILLFFVLYSCTTIGARRIWTVQETKDWYKENFVDQPKQSRPFTSPLYYQGTDDKIHYFISRYMDEWVFINIKKDDVVIADLRPKWTSNQKDSQGSIGYYPVDPLDNFKKLVIVTEGQ